MSILTLGNNLKQNASTSRRPFFERNRTTHPARSTISHPQLRDLLICPDLPHHVQTISGNGVDTHLLGQYTMSLMDVPTSFAPNCLVHGCGMMAMGGENADLLIRSTDITSKWEIKTQTGRSIVNSACFHQFSNSFNPQLLVCNNDQTITQYDISKVTEIQAAASNSLSVDTSHHLPTTTSASNRIGSQDNNDEERIQADEKPILTSQGSIHLPVPVNHCSISQDSRLMVAVGDSNEVFLYDCHNSTTSNSTSITSWNSKTKKLHLPGVSSSTGSFSTSWNQSSDKFAVASEGEVVVVFDIKMLDKPLLVKKTTQNGRAGAARVVKFTPEGPNELLAFTEHRSLVHVIDARTFDPDHDETLIVPTPLPGINPNPIRLPPGTIRLSSLNDNRLIQSWMRGSTSHRSSTEEGEVNVLPETEEEEGEGEGEERQRSLDEPSRERRRSEGGHGMEEVLWGELGENRGSGNGTEENAYRSSLVRRSNRLSNGIGRNERNGTRWAGVGTSNSTSGSSNSNNVRIGFPSSSSNLNSNSIPSMTRRNRRNHERTEDEGEGEEDEEEECIIQEMVPNDLEITRLFNQRERELHQSSTVSDSTSSSGSTNQNNLIIRSNPIETNTRRIQIGGSSLRMINLQGSSTSGNLGLEHTSNLTESFNEQIRRLTNRNLHQTWLDVSSGSMGQGALGLHHHHHLRSGMWDDLVGVSWTIDGEYLVSGTEVGLVEWKVKRCFRTGFGDSRLC
ncbi:uncharacterized protein MELLADRAFT_79680 [Melampsora larici-populina 98AG31]|uniref:DUF2415 domain-containing protein n=1 Tax=Melampsora larici-populina (strain 98AG31 / pathotype 3-4-7) TaxID=747676 RepID=F4SA05_MELLP|nr:uncharacterized protein MELLADRAFT_79680 [Melampsora larici-populina 98AG31]EGF98521.1 hypothetical protein MELLADRAFT_79680 [Melampsora larici-populina 98AG31]